MKKIFKNFRYFAFFILPFLIMSNIHANNRYTINLSQPPAERWAHILAQYDKEDLRQYAKSIDDNISTTVPVLKSQLARKLLNTVGWYVSRGDGTAEWFDEIHQEIKGLSNALKQKMDGETLDGFREEDLFLLNIGYDFSTYCTSGVYIDTQSSNPKPILFRNLDWDIDLFRKFSFEAVFIKNNQELFRSVNFLGQIGVLTGIKPHAFAVALNYRKKNKKDYIFENEILANLKSALLNGGWANSLLIRYALEHDNNYADAKHRFISTQLIAPSYLTLAGINATEGVVIERDRNSSFRQRSFDDLYENKNFLVQTNHDLPIPNYQNEEWADNDPLLSEKFGMGTLKRRETAVSYLSHLSHNSNPNDDIKGALLNMLLNINPVFNEQTIFSSILDPANNILIWQPSGH